MDACCYCREKRGHTKQHLITRNQARRNMNAARYRNDARFVLRCCIGCNLALGTRLRIPEGYAFADDLERVTGTKYATWNGSAEGLREVVR